MSWLGAVAIQPGRLVYSGRVGPSHEHSHATLLLMLTTSGRVRLGDAAGRWREAPSAVVPVGERHSLRGLLSSVLMVYVEPDAAIGRALNARIIDLGSGPASSVDTWVRAAEPLGELGASLTVADPDAAAEEALQHLVGGKVACTPPTSHPDLRRALAVLPDMLTEPVRLPELAAVVSLSPDRLGRLFSTELGLSFPAYVRWLRMRQAIERLRGGDTLTAAAHAAGFSDSAHLNRTVHEMFGLPPAAIARRITWH